MDRRQSRPGGLANSPDQNRPGGFDRHVLTLTTSRQPSRNSGRVRGVGPWCPPQPPLIDGAAAPARVSAHGFARPIRTQRAPCANLHIATRR